MKKQSEAATVEKAPQGRKCSICTHSAKERINSLIADGVSFRGISRQFVFNDSMQDSIRRHAQNCLKIDLQAAIELKKLEQRIDFGSTMTNLFYRTEKLTRALEKWLSDPNDENEFDVSPRGDELSVVYLDYADTNAQGEPKRKTEKLHELLRRFESASGNSAIAVQSSATDNRKLFLESMKTLGDRLEQYAKHFGEYAKDNEQKRSTFNITENKLNLVQIAVEQARQLNADPLEIYRELVPLRVSSLAKQGQTVSAEDFEVADGELV